MLDQIFKSILLTSAIGTFFTGILLLIKPVTNKRFSCGWHYYMWLAVLFVMLCPVRLAKIRLPYERVTQYNQSAQYTQTNDLQETPVNDTLENNKTFIADKELSVLKTIPSKTIFLSIIKQINFSAIWLGMVFLLLFGKIIGYMVFIKTIKKNSYTVICPTLEQYTKRKISVRKSSKINSPLVTGVIKPILLLPDSELSDEEFNNILLHETTHLKRQDILYKWFAETVKCIHWFNPMIYIICNKINTDCEISCDNAVVQNMNTDEKQCYIDTILSLLTTNKDKYIPLTTGMSGNMKNLRRRFNMIKNTANTTKTIRVLSVILSAFLLCSSLIISGSAAAELLGDNYKITVTNQGKEIELKNKPFIKYNTVYLPLREMLQTENIDEITYDNGMIQFFVYSKNGPVQYRGNNYDFWINRVRIDNPVVYIGGFSYGSTENDVMLNPPVLTDGVTYVPYELFEMLNQSGQGVFDTLTVTTDSISTPISGASYRNEEMNFVLDLPLSWSGRYAAEKNGDIITFYHKAIKDKYGAGILFHITAEDGVKTKRDFEESPVSQRIIATTLDKTYTLILPSDVQAPVWIEHDDEDVKLAEEYYKMSEDIDFIADSINIIVTTLYSSNSYDNSIRPENTVTTFFDAFNIGDYSYMRNFCTESCIEKYFTENNIFGIERASLVQLDIDIIEYLKSSNDFNICAEYRKNSNSEQTEKLYIRLMRQPSGVYFIDDLNTEAF